VGRADRYGERVSWFWLLPVSIVVLGTATVAVVPARLQAEVDALRVAMARAGRLAVAVDELAHDVGRLAGTDTRRVRR
jgi:hypothetical protein